MTAEDINVQIGDKSEEVIQQTNTLKLYFIDEESNTLIPQNIEVNIDGEDSTLNKPQITLKYLMESSAKEHLSTPISSEDIVLEHTKVDEELKICQVILTKQFENKANSISYDMLKLSIYSMVNSLTEIEDIDEVQFLIEGEKKESLAGFEINEPIKRDEPINNNDSE